MGSAGDKRKKRNVRERTPLASNFIRGRVERLKERKKKERCARRRKKGKHDFPNISSKCEVYCEKKYTILDI